MSDDAKYLPFRPTAGSELDAELLLLALLENPGVFMTDGQLNMRVPAVNRPNVAIIMHSLAVGGWVQRMVQAPRRTAPMRTLRTCSA
ncbi:hypothetical protein GCM10029964_120550 [Kibdelosporangium lantanae]